MQTTTFAIVVVIACRLFSDGLGLVAAEGRLPGDLAVIEYAPTQGTFAGCTHIFFQNRLEVVTAGRRLHFRDQPNAPFRESPVALFDDAHSVVYNPRDRLFYATDTGRHRLLTFRNPAQAAIEQSVIALPSPAESVVPNDSTAPQRTWSHAARPFPSACCLVAEYRRCNLPTGIAVDAGRVHKEITGDVFRNSLVEIRQARIIRAGHRPFNRGAAALNQE